MDERYLELIAMHEARFGEKEVSLFSTSGRTELGGNHTDHNLGCVLAASINLDTISAVSRRKDRKIILDSQGFPLVEISLDDLSARKEERGSTASLIRGIASAFQERGFTLTGWQASVKSNVLGGSGLSSSAAIEVLIATIINQFDAGLSLSTTDLALISQYAENTYFGKPSGLLDQMACAHGGVVAIDFKDPLNPIIESIETDFEKYGYRLVITDTKGDHSDLTDCYASIPKEMQLIASLFGKKHLREVDEKRFREELPTIRKQAKNDRAILRAIHFFDENERVKKMVASLRKEEMQTYLDLVNQSGESSFCFLQNGYAPEFSHCQPIALAIAISKEILGEEGAVRLHGGGFAGTIQAYVPLAMEKRYIQHMEHLFGKGCSNPITIRPLKTSMIG